MSKTAEEILKENALGNHGGGVVVPESVIKAMREFAAQEVEAYKERLKAELDKPDVRNALLLKIRELIEIDTVK